MKFKIAIFFYLIGNLACAQNQELDVYKTASIREVIRLFQKKDVDSILKIVHFPLKRAYPVPAVENETELKIRFHQVFDSTLINAISRSKISQWSEVGYHGIMFNNGILWIDPEGKIMSLNYQSDFEKQFLKKMIIQQKKALHVSLKTFVKPIYKIQTKNYLIRIDELKNRNYRYAAWKVNDPESSKPALVLVNGSREFIGTGGNEAFTFSNGVYNYKIYRNIIGADDDPEISLIVEKRSRQILSENGKLLEK